MLLLLLACYTTCLADHHPLTAPLAPSCATSLAASHDRPTDPCPTVDRGARFSLRLRLHRKSGAHLLHPLPLGPRPQSRTSRPVLRSRHGTCGLTTSYRKFFFAVTALVFLDILGNGFACWNAWYFCILNWGNMSALRGAPWTLGLNPPIIGLCSMIVQTCELCCNMFLIAS